MLHSGSANVGVELRLQGCHLVVVPHISRRVGVCEPAVGRSASHQNPTPILRSDNVLTFTARRSRAVCHDCHPGHGFQHPLFTGAGRRGGELVPLVREGVRSAGRLGHIPQGKDWDCQLHLLTQRASAGSGRRLSEPATVVGLSTSRPWLEMRGAQHESVRGGHRER